MSETETLIGGAQRPYERPAGALELQLVRHGAYARGSEPGAEDLFGIVADPPLNALGREQAALVSERLAKSRFDAVYTSSLKRTAQTAAPLLRQTGQDGVVVDDLREIYLGDFDGQEFERQRAAGNPLIATAITERSWDLIPGAERGTEFTTRVVRGLESVADATGYDATAVAFVHSAVIAEICAHITGSHPFAFLAAENTSITTVIRYASGRWELRSFNDTAHLRR